jgi:hypothetical protein
MMSSQAWISLFIRPFAEESNAALRLLFDETEMHEFADR